MPVFNLHKPLQGRGGYNRNLAGMPTTGEQDEFSARAHTSAADSNINVAADRPTGPNLAALRPQAVVSPQGRASTRPRRV